MKKYDRGWASLEIGAALLIVMIIVAWGAGIWQDYLKTKGWQAEARLVSNWASAARSYIGKNYTTLQASSTTTTPAVITTTMLKNTGFLSSGFTETKQRGAAVTGICSSKHPKPGITTGNGCIQWWHPLSSESTYPDG